MIYCAPGVVCSFSAKKNGFPKVICVVICPHESLWASGFVAEVLKHSSFHTYIDSRIEFRIWSPES